jgi:hypothetical protein
MVTMQFALSLTYVAVGVASGSFLGTFLSFAYIKTHRAYVS